jgi:redox-sensitive bicupin YhaK (pirin superfamily)
MTPRPLAQYHRLPCTDHGRDFIDYAFSDQLGFLDPFLVLSDFQMSRAYFPPHPHAGFSVMTYLFEDSPGAFVNRDSFGDHSRIEAGALHWTQAGRGLQHEEIPEQEGQRCHGLQMWINHADRDRLAEPARFHLSADQVPEVRPAAGIRVRVLVGEAFGVRAAFKPLTPIHFLEVFVAPGATLHYPSAAPTALALLVAGSAHMDNQLLEAHDIVTFGPVGDTLALQGGEAGCQFLLGTGQPFQEPIAFGGPFVMNTTDQLTDAKRRFSRGEMGALAPSAVFR